MRKAIWTIVLAGLGLIVSTYIAGVLDRSFETSGLYNWAWFPNFLIGILSDLNNLSQNYWAQIFATAVVGFAAGLALDRAMENSEALQKEALKKLGMKAMDLHRRMISRSGFPSGYEDCMDAYRTDVTSLFIGLRKHGFVTPKAPEGAAAKRIVEEWEGYLGPVGKFLWDEHFVEAKKFASDVVREFQSGDT